MPCYKPLDAYIATGKTENGKKVITFKRPKTFMEQIQLPCGQCIGCRQRRVVTWAARCMHEMQMHEQNSFITLTYDDEHLPEDRSLDKSHIQNFFKRLRKELYPKKIRYFMCGEYGGNTWRPHFHAIIFGYDFPDKYRIQSTETEHPYFISEQLGKLWPDGFHIIAEANYETAAYVAGYCVKKVNGEKAAAHYSRILTDWNEVTGEITYMREVELLPEFAQMSTGRKKGQGIGGDWYKKYKNDCYPSDYLIHEGKKLPIPKYYDRMLETEEESRLRRIKFKRKMHAKMNAEENRISRLRQKEHCKEQTLKSFKRAKI